MNSELEVRYDHLRNEYTKLLGKLELMTEEKERCRKLAIDYSLKADGYKMDLEMCQNMRLAKEFAKELDPEDLHDTEHIAVALELLRGIKAENAKLREALEEIIARCELRILDDDAHAENYYEAKQALQALESEAQDASR